MSVGTGSHRYVDTANKKIQSVILRHSDLTAIMGCRSERSLSVNARFGGGRQKMRF